MSRSAWLGIAAIVVAHLSGCATRAGSVPAEFTEACGHPGTTIIAARVPVTVPRAGCDLTGVIVRYGAAGATVPTSGSVFEIVDFATDYVIDGGDSITIDVDPRTGDVTISA